MMDEPTPIGMPMNGTFTHRRKGKRRKRKTHGVLFVRNLRTGTKSKFKSTCSRREDNMTDVIESLMLLYAENPSCIEKQLREVKDTRRQTNKRIP